MICKDHFTLGALFVEIPGLSVADLLLCSNERVDKDLKIIYRL